MELKDYIYILRRRFIWFVTFFILTLVVFYITYLMQEKKYLYVNTLSYQPRISNLPMQILTKSVGDIQFTKSQEFWLDVIRTKEFLELTNQIYNYLKEHRNVLQKQENITPKDIENIITSAKNFSKVKKIDVSELIPENVNVYFTRDNRYLNVECAHKEREIAYLVTLSIALSYIKFGNSEAVNGIEQLKQTYTDKINTLSAEEAKVTSPTLEKISRIKIDYDSIRNLVNILHEQIVGLYSERISLLEKIKEAGKYLKTKNIPNELQLPYKSEQTKMMEQQLFQTKMQLKSLQFKVTPDHPEYKRLTEVVKILTENIAEERYKDLINYYRNTNKQVEEIDKRIIILKEQKEEEDKKLALLQEEYDKISYQNNRLIEIKNEKQILKRELMNLESILGQTPSYFSFYLGGLPQLKSETMKPIKKYTLLWLLIAIVTGIIAAYARESMDTTIKSEFDIKKYLNLELLGIIPYTHKFQLVYGEDTEQKHIEEKSIMQELYTAVASIINEKCSIDKRKILTITSSVKYEGKSVCSYNLAYSFAGINKKTLLIDGDARSPVLHKYFKLDNVKGFFNLSTHNINECVITINHNLYFLPAGRGENNTIEYLTKESIKEILQGLKTKFDIILIDAPPLMNVSDSLILAKISDGAILLVAAGAVNRGVAKWSKHLLENVNVKIIGSILNKAFIGVTPSYYTYYYYHKDYSERKTTKS
ncbi:MAG: polysaccharide biosynthesis tyrosine autokinase [Planctomycetota bacterium]